MVHSRSVSAFFPLLAAFVPACASDSPGEVQGTERDTVAVGDLAASPAPIEASGEAASGEPTDDVVSQAQLEEWTAVILKEIEELREAKFPRDVSVAVADRDKMREYMKERMDKTSTPIQAEADETCGKLLGLIPGDMDYMAEMMRILDSQVGGFYDPDTEGFFLMDRFGGFLARTILAHELTHALDDQLYDIDGTLEAREGNADAQFAYHAVVEGSGTAVMNTWSLRHMSEFDPSEILDGGAMGMDELKDALPYTWKPLLGLYMRGAAFLSRTTSVMKGAMQMPALADVDVAFRRPPASSEQVLHPRKYWDDAHRDEPIEVALGAGSIPPGWSVLFENTFGEFMWGLVVEPLEERGGIESQLAVLAARYTFAASEGWGGDRYLYLGRGDARALLSYSVWDSDADATEFRAAIGGLKAHLEDASATTARSLGVEGAGTFVREGADARGVWLVSWVGATAPEAEALVAAVEVTVGEAR